MHTEDTFICYITPEVHVRQTACSGTDNVPWEWGRVPGSVGSWGSHALHAARYRVARRRIDVKVGYMLTVVCACSDDLS